MSIPATYSELPGIVSPGIIGVLMTCHGNWQSAIALMDQSILPRPPLMVTVRYAVEIAGGELVAPGQELRIRSRVRSVSSNQEPFTVDVAIEVLDAHDEAVCFATGMGVFQKIGAARSFS